MTAGAPALRLVYMGTAAFAVPSLRALAAGPHEVVAVYTQPARAAGRGLKARPSPVHTAALEFGLVVRTPETLKVPAEQEVLAGFRADLAVVAAYGLILPKNILEVPRLGCINLHASLLPRWRGAAPIERAIMAGDERTGVSIMGVTAGLDSGPVGLREELPIGPEDDFATLSEKLAALGGELLIGALDRQGDGRLELVEQEDGEATYAEKIDSAERRLDPSRPATELARTVRALTPHVGAYLEAADGERLGVRRARAVDVSVRTGEVRAEWGALLLGCGRGALRLEVVQPPGGRPMAADAYLRGHPVPAL